MYVSVCDYKIIYIRTHIHVLFMSISTHIRVCNALIASKSIISSTLNFWSIFIYMGTHAPKVYWKFDYRQEKLSLLFFLFQGINLLVAFGRFFLMEHHCLTHLAFITALIVALMHSEVYFSLTFTYAERGDFKNSIVIISYINYKTICETVISIVYCCCLQRGWWVEKRGDGTCIESCECCHIVSVSYTHLTLPTNREV